MKRTGGRFVKTGHSARLDDPVFDPGRQRLDYVFMRNSARRKITPVGKLIDWFYSTQSAARPSGCAEANVEKKELLRARDELVLREPKDTPLGFWNVL